MGNCWRMWSRLHATDLGVDMKLKKLLFGFLIVLGLGAVGIAAQMFLAPALYAGCPVVSPPSNPPP
jgi:hypothetical protein